MVDTDITPGPVPGVMPFTATFHPLNVTEPDLPAGGLFVSAGPIDMRGEPIKLAIGEDFDSGLAH